MRVRSGLIATLVFGAGLVMGPLVGGASETQEDTHTSQAQKARGPGAGGEEIKNRSPKNEAGDQALAPPEKGGDEKTRGQACKLHVDNRTLWRIQIFVDGRYVGLVSPFGDSIGYYSCGAHRLFGLAEFVDAPDLTWGPHSLKLPGRWTLQK